MKLFLKNNRYVLWGLIIGAAGGFLYWYFVGCTSGTCSITSRPLNSTLYVGFVGGLIGSMFSKK